MNIRKQNLHNDKQDKHPNFSWPHDMTEGEGTSREAQNINTNTSCLMLLTHNDRISLLLN